jgi:hypothetical protein
MDKSCAAACPVCRAHYTRTGLNLDWRLHSDGQELRIVTLGAPKPHPTPTRR